MNYQSNTIKAIGFGAMLLVLVFAAFVSFVPAQAHAQVYNYGGHSSGAYDNYNPVYAPYRYPPVTRQPVIYQQPIVYQQPVVYQQPIVYSEPAYYQYPALSAYCYADNTSVQTGTSVEWVASVSGGNGNYSYTWSGTDGLTGYGSYTYMTYYNSGWKTAALTVYSNGQYDTVNCNSSVDVYQVYSYEQPTYVQPVTYVQPAIAYNQSSNAGLDIGCYADPTTATVNQPVTWSVEVTGGEAPYTYSWSGSDGLTGSGSSIIKYYDTSGDKSAIVNVTSADGETGTRACSDSLTVHSVATHYAVAYRTAPAAPQTVQPAVQSNPLPAAATLSLNGIPWGWVAVLIILVLFATIIYLLFNRPKI